MVKALAAAIALLAGVLGMADPAAARKTALLVGNADYAHADRLDNPHNDVARMEETLRALGYDEIIVKRDLGERALGRALQDFAEQARGADTALVFFSGHGMELGGRNYLIPTDAELRRPGDERFEAIELSFAIDAAAGASRLSVVIIDACRNGAPGATRSLARGFAPVTAQAGLAVAFSTSPGEPAYDSGGRGLSPFTRALTEVLAEEPTIDIRNLFTSLGDLTSRYAGAPQEPMGRFGRLPRGLVSLGDAEAPRPAPVAAVGDDADLIDELMASPRHPGDTFGGNWARNAVQEALVTRFDLDGSGMIDRPREVRAIECDVWQALETSFGGDLLALLGFSDGAWMGGEIGFAESMRARAYSAGAACGLKAPISRAPPKQFDD